MKVVIDQPRAPEGRVRCVHDLLDGECAWCLGIECDIPFTIDMEGFS